MKLKVFTLRPDEETGSLDDTALVNFFEDPVHPREVLEISEHFFVHEHEPCWAILTMYRDTGARRATSGGDEKKDWRADLTSPEKILFDELRAWRNHRSKGDGVPPYIIATNRQLAEIARSQPGNVSGLLEIAGLGQGKVSRWGEELVALVRAHGGAAAGDVGEANNE